GLDCRGPWPRFGRLWDRRLPAWPVDAYAPPVPCTSEQTDGGVASQLEATLFGSYEVGYPKDIVRWSEELALKPEIERRILRIYAERTLIGSLDRAVQYFRGSALRKDALFVSYSGEDADAVSPIIAALRHCGIAALRERFQQVFDYRAPDQP